MTPRSPVAVTMPLPDRVGHRGHLTDPDGRRWSWREALQGLAHGGTVGAELERVIAGAPWDGVFWECAPVLGTALDAAFEWVLLESRAVARLRADASPFSAPMVATAAKGVAVFENLGGDAVLVAPCPGAAEEQCAHLVAFLRTATPSRRSALWHATSLAARAQLARHPQQPLWLSTSGLGVSWLHIRLDVQPKYYTYAPFRVAP